MIPALPLRIVFPFLLAALPLACAAKYEAGEDKPQPPEGVAMPISELTAAERKTALEIVRGDPQLKAKLAAKKVYLIGVEVMRDKEAERQKPPHRLALITHYQADGDVTILATVDLTTNKVIREEHIQNLATPLSQDEIDLAEKLARARPEVKKLLAPHGDKVEVQALLSRAALRTDPAFGHRVVHLLFRVGPDYLGTRVAVDLTTDQATIEAPVRPDQPEHKD